MRSQQNYLQEGPNDLSDGSTKVGRSYGEYESTLAMS